MMGSYQYHITLDGKEISKLSTRKKADSEYNTCCKAILFEINDAAEVKLIRKKTSKDSQVPELLAKMTVTRAVE